MMKEEFEERIGQEIPYDLYEQLIEPVYTAYNRFDSKEAVAEFWKQEGYPGFRILKEPLAEYISVKGSIRTANEDIEALERRIAELKALKAGYQNRLRAMELQYQISSHWGASA